MATLIYAPEVRIRIRTAPESRGKGKVIDVSHDISRGSVTRITKGVSTARVTLLNQSRKYDGMFSPMDTMVVYMRRIRTVLKFSGYLDEVPKWSAEPGSINITASCTMKRLQQFLWDPTSAPAVAMLNEIVANEGSMQDGGAAQKTVQLLNEVAGWPTNQIHIARIPENWYDTISSVADELIAESEAATMASAMGSGSWMNGSNPITSGSATVTSIGEGTGTLPASRGKVSQFGGPNGGAYGNMALTGESGTNPTDPWYCAMRWGYYPNPEAVDGAKQWWVNRKILVVNPANQKAVVLRAADWGPHTNTGRVLDVGPQGLKALGAVTDDTVHIAFAPEDANLGPVSAPDASAGGLITGAGSATGAPGGAQQWGAPGDESNIVTVTAGGLKFQVHRLARTNFIGFVNDLVSTLGYTPKSIGGYNDRNISGTTKKSNHAWGLAIDIDPTQNPFVRGGTANYTLPKPPQIIALARKWGLGWGGEWNNSKDYMHFEVIGAPSSGTYDGISGSGMTAADIVIAKWKPPVTGYRISAHFGDGGSNWSSGTHSGTDFAVAAGTPIHPVGPGTVNDRGSGDASYGNWISIDHGGDNYTFYAHMEAPTTFAIGAQVGTSATLGGVGETGNATGPHVHVEYRRGEDSYAAATTSGGIEKYVLGGANRADPPTGSQTVDGDYSETAPDLTSSDVGGGLFNAFLFNLGQLSAGGALLTGYRALLNDVPIFGTVETLMAVASRDFSSAPNGDFIAWFPDYFGLYGQAGKMVISSMEISGVSGPPTVGWSDRNLKTHQFVTSASAPNIGDANTLVRQYQTAGVASIEFPELMMALLNISRKEAETMRDTYLNRYGPRVEVTTMNDITGPRAEFFYACHLFQKNWSQQYQASLNLMFMPELYPGMLACFPEYGIQGYVTETTDTFDLSGNGMFETTISCAPWSSIGKNSSAAADGLPIGGDL